MNTNAILNCDCLNLLPNLPDESVNFVLTDPPYLVGYKSRDGRAIANDDNDRWLKPAFAQMYRVLEPNAYCVSFYGWPHADRFLQAFRAAGFRVVGHFTFPKRYTSSTRYLQYRHENAYLLAKGLPEVPEKTIPDVINWVYTGNKLHPTQKPLQILLPIVEAFSRRGGTVLDPFAGSGSSLLAAKMLGRNWIGAEIDPAYHAIAQERLKQSIEPSIPAAPTQAPLFSKPTSTMAPAQYVI
jgi:adenine-specific DNA-methyltransferase